MRSFRSLRPRVVVLLVLCVAVLGAAASNLAPVPPASVEVITPDELRMHLEFLTSPELGGRYTLAPNFSIAARYLAAHLKAYGFQGAGDHGDFLQHFGVISYKNDFQNSSLSLTIQGQTEKYGFGDFYPGGSGVGKAEGQIVFVGYGISAPAQKHDDYANLDVKGKIVLIASGAPAGFDRSLIGPGQIGDGAAIAHGAVGILQIPPPARMELMKRKDFKDRAAMRETVRLAKETEGAIPAALLTGELAQKLIESAGLRWNDIRDAAQNGGVLTPKTTDASAALNVALQERMTTTQNVVGILPGSDPALRKEYVVISAHYDHLQTNEKGQIYPGADDDGSGTTSVLNVARAMSLDPPKRSVMIVFHAGEELGLLGSKYNTDYAPAVPLDHIVADLNIDMIGRSKAFGDQEPLDTHLTDAHTIYVVGSDRISKELDRISKETNSEYQKLNLDYYYNDPANPERIYFRSDHWNYAKHGIPVIFYFDGTHVDYHQPTDTIDKIDFKKMAKVAQLVFETGWRLGNLDHPLARDGKIANSK